MDGARRRRLLAGAAGGATAAAIVFMVRFRRRRRTERLDGTGSPGPTAGVAARPRGEGLYLVTNPEAGPVTSSDPSDELEDRLPAATVVRLTDDHHLPELFDQGAAAGADAFGMAGGDGSLSCAAERAVEHHLPLMMVPAGTLNHLARDLGVTSVDDAVRAVAAGQAVEMDVGEVDDHLFLNTASFGGYVELVDAREHMERFVGKWPAVLVALVRVLRRFQPMDVELAGERRRVWLVFVGNGLYHPQGFVPSRRQRLDDGQLDIRLVDGTAPWARARLVAAVLTGTLARSPVYEEYSAERLEVRSHGGRVRLALDGETVDGPDHFVIRKRPDRLTVYTPLATPAP